jgi:hypothetical protein
MTMLPRSDQRPPSIMWSGGDATRRSVSSLIITCRCGQGHRSIGAAVSTIGLLSSILCRLLYIGDKPLSRARDSDSTCLLSSLGRHFHSMMQRAVLQMQLVGIYRTPCQQDEWQSEHRSISFAQEQGIRIPPAQDRLETNGMSMDMNTLTQE